MNSIQILLDTNIWIFGLSNGNPHCTRIIKSINQFHLHISEQIRIEVQRSLPYSFVSDFYRVIHDAGLVVDADPPPARLADRYKGLGLKKGDVVIGAYCEWRSIDILVSDNRDFLRGITSDLPFDIMSPYQFCEQFDLL